VNDDVGAVLEGTDQVRGCDRVVRDQRDTVLVRDVGDASDVEHVRLRVADRLREEQLRVGTDRTAPLVEVVLVLDEGRLDAELRERVLEEVEGTAVDGARRHDVVARLRDVQDREGLGSLSARDEQGARAALERGDALLGDVLRGVHDAGVDVARLGEREQVRRVIRVAEHVCRGLVERGRAGARGRVRLRTRVDLAGLEGPLSGVGHGGSPVTDDVVA
jgi:hypothetical protein